MKTGSKQAKDKIKKKLRKNKIIAGLNKKMKMEKQTKNRMRNWTNKKMINKNKKDNGN